MLTLLLVVLVFLFVTGEVSGAQAIALGIAGVVAPFLSQLLKRVTGLSGNAALFVTILISAGITIGAMYFTGDIHSIGDVAKQIGTVFAIATVIFKVFIADSSLNKPAT